MKGKKKDFGYLIYKIYISFGIIFFTTLAIFLSLFGNLEKADLQFSDMIYQFYNYRTKESVVSIIAIDDETEKQLGEFEDWSRGQTAELIELLNSAESVPSVIALGLDYSTAKDTYGDVRLAKVCEKAGNVCMSSFIVVGDAVFPQKTPLSITNIPQQNPFVQGTQEMDMADITDISLPYKNVLPYVTTGVINNLQIAGDGFARTAVLGVTYEDKEYDSFAVAVYKMYQEAKGKEVKLPKVDEDNAFQFLYTNKSADYAIYSFYDVISGKVDLTKFADSVVLIGDYTAENSTFQVPNQRKIQMQSIEVQANIVDALLSQNTGQPLSYSYLAGFYALFAILFFVSTSYSSGKRTFLTAVILIILQIIVCGILNALGYYILILIPIILVVCITIFNLGVRVIMTQRNNYRLKHAFKKYVDKSIVDEIVENGNLDVHVGGTVRDIAVLFVDIRGYTSLSENLQPEQMVDILNQYLALAASAVAKNKGTLDKFIGDAAMAVFNSPTDLDDYEYRAVCAAWDFLHSTKQLSELCEKKYGKQITFGIGIHCGNAVTGNIGCEARMDYTAIGDTVNTASRLEGIAEAGQILISEEMKKRIGSRICTSYGGEVSLKGKKEKVPVYIVENVEEQEAEQEKRLFGLDIKTSVLEKWTKKPQTPQAIQAKLYCIPSLKELHKYEQFAKEYHAAFEYNDFFVPEVLDDEEKVKDIVAQYMRLDRDRSEDTLHGAFLDICVNSNDKKIFEVSDLRIRQCMEIAAKMGLKAVIFHTNFIVNFKLKFYLDDWVDRNELYWRRLLQEYPNQSIYLENMFDDTPQLLTALAERMLDEPRFAVCLDTAHAFISGSSLESWFTSMAPYVAHMHLNDNNKHEDLHHPIGMGAFPWDVFQRWVSGLERKPSVLIEVRSFEDLQKSIEYMKEHGIYPFDKEEQEEKAPEAGNGC